MFRPIAVLFVLTLVPTTHLTTKAAAGPPRTLEGWGEVVDPAGDCRFTLGKEKLTIAVPGTKHDLSVESGNMTAPRVFADVEGDFIAQVKVAGNVCHAGQGLAEGYLPYHGAGLLLFVDGQTYIRLERAAIVGPEGNRTHYANFELRENGKMATGNAAKIPDVDDYLRLERKGGRVIASVSDNGLRWTPMEPITVKLPKRVKLGVAAVNTSTDPFKVEFSEWEVFTKDRRPPNP